MAPSSRGLGHRPFKARTPVRLRVSEGKQSAGRVQRTKFATTSASERHPGPDKIIDFVGWDMPRAAIRLGLSQPKNISGPIV